MQAQASTQRPAPTPRHHAESGQVCGWYDSSFELGRGLEVRELSDLELLALWRDLRPQPAALLH